MDNDQLEQAIQDKGLTAPRITVDHIKSIVHSVYYHVPPATTLTLCVLTLKNGFTVVGQSACAHAANFDRELGERLARDDAENKIWVLEGYLLRDRLFNSRSV